MQLAKDNLTVVTPSLGLNIYSVFQIKPYSIDSDHQAISRVLQAYESILLMMLAKQCLIFSYMPLVLAHDGSLALTGINSDSRYMGDLMKIFKILPLNALVILFRFQRKNLFQGAAFPVVNQIFILERMTFLMIM